MDASASLIVSIGAFALLWTGSIISMTLWLANRFRQVEKIIYYEINKHAAEDNIKFSEMKERLIILELQRQGWTKVP